MDVFKRMVVSDLDGTLLGDDEALRCFSDWWSDCRDGSALVYASGRLFESIVDAVESTPLPTPDVVISAVGTQIRQFPLGEPLLEWPRLESPWSRNLVCQALREFSRLRLQPDEFQSEHKVSYFLIDATGDELEQIKASLSACDLGFELIYSSREHLDVLPHRTNKGFAACALAEHWKIEAQNVIVCGDTGNDSAMFCHGFRGVVVANGHDELKQLAGADAYLAAGRHAAGVLEGLKHWQYEAL